MNERRQRLVLWSGALVLTLSLYLQKGHEAPSVGAPPVAFLHGRNGAVAVRVAGDIPQPGVYEVPARTTVAELLRQAAPGTGTRFGDERLLSATLDDGDVITVKREPDTSVTTVRGTMPARERLVLGIPLDPSRMTYDDWEALPGIGPFLAERITAFVRERGGIAAPEDLLEVDGIGERTVEKLRPLFRRDPK